MLCKFFMILKNKCFPSLFHVPFVYRTGRVFLFCLLIRACWEPRKIFFTRSRTPLSATLPFWKGRCVFQTPKKYIFKLVRPTHRILRFTSHRYVVSFLPYTISTNRCILHGFYLLVFSWLSLIDTRLLTGGY